MMPTPWSICLIAVCLVLGCMIGENDERSRGRCRRQGVDAARSRARDECLSAHAADAAHGPDAEQGRTQPAVADHASRSFEGLDRIQALQHQCRAGRVGRSAARWYRPPFNCQQLLVPVVSEAIGRDALWTKPRFVRSRHLPRRRCWIRSNVSSLCRPKAKSFQRCCVERRGENRQHPQGPFAGFGNGVYLAGRLALCVLLDSRCLASMSPAQRAALDRTQFNDFRCCSLAA